MVKEMQISCFVALCVESYTNKHGMAGEAFYELFDRKGISRYLSDYYDVLYTQSIDWILEKY